VRRATKKSNLKKSGISSAIALGVLVTGVGVAGAATHATTSDAAAASATSKTSGTSTPPPMAPGPGFGIGGDVASVSSTSITVVNPAGTSTTYGVSTSTTVTKDRQSATFADVVVGDNVHITVSSSDPTLATAIDVAPAMIVGTVSALNGDTITVTGPNGATGTIVVDASTTYMKSGASAALSNVAVGTVIVAQGTFGATPTTLDASSVGIGQPGTGPGPGPFRPGGPVGAAGGPGAAGAGTPPPMKGGTPIN
jgi:hypothetical protein